MVERVGYNNELFRPLMAVSLVGLRWLLCTRVRRDCIGDSPILTTLWPAQGGCATRGVAPSADGNTGDDVAANRLHANKGLTHNVMKK
jgi:hypothetical protein